MSDAAAQGYPLSDYANSVAKRGRRGKSLDEITLASVMEGEVTMEDLRITRQALQAQAQIARTAGREALARNFARAAELVDVPQDVIMATYEMLRPGRVRKRSALLTQAAILRERYGAEKIAKFIEEAAEIGFRRGLLKED